MPNLLSRLKLHCGTQVLGRAGQKARSEADGLSTHCSRRGKQREVTEGRVLSSTLPISFRSGPPFTSDEPSFWQKPERGTPFPLLQLTAAASRSPLLMPTWDFTRGLDEAENGGANGYPLFLLASIIRKHHFITIN
ncbi:hypothetical protein EYF80_000473 [Liparis tanakae]|uniref:Uncharacterized protein n=1 Tax=Liparis tanakae TaxID=230148 RepID=A0A4Z2JG10_9TELE|nr:hypothetical protein EYF80_000473 [Liparis tanakae]